MIRVIRVIRRGGGLSLHPDHTYHPYHPYDPYDKGDKGDRGDKGDKEGRGSGLGIGLPPPHLLLLM